MRNAKGLLRSPMIINIMPRLLHILKLKRLGIRKQQPRLRRIRPFPLATIPSIPDQRIRRHPRAKHLIVLAVHDQHGVRIPQRGELAERDRGDLAQGEGSARGVVLGGDGRVIVAVVEGSLGAAGAGGDEVGQVWGGKPGWVDEEGWEGGEGQDEFEAADCEEGGEAREDVGVDVGGIDL